MKALPYYQHYVKDWLVATGGLTLSERGLYITLLNVAWENGARLPDNPAELRRWCGVDRQQWGRVWPRVRPFWRLEDLEGDGVLWWTNKRQREDWAALIARGERARANGSKGGRPRKPDANAPKNVPPRTGRIGDGNGLKNVPRIDAKSLKNNDPAKPVGFSGKTQDESNQNQNQNHRDSKEESLPPLAPKGGRREGRISTWRFERFWEAWPDKRGEAQAKRAFMFLEADVGDRITEEELIAATLRYAANPGTSRYMAASKYLSDHRFMDAAPVLPPNSEKGSGVVTALSAIFDGDFDDDSSRGPGSELPRLAAKPNGPVIEATANRHPSEQDGEGSRRPRNSHQKQRS